MFPLRTSRGIALTIGTTTVKYANFLFQSPDWGLNSGFAGTGKFACCSPGYTCISFNVPPANQQGDCFDHRNDDGQICKFPLSIPGLGIEFRLRRNREIRVLLPWIHLHFTQCSPCEKQADIISAIDIVKHSPCGFAGGFAFIAGTSAINAQIFPCNLRIGASPLAPGHPQQRKYCLKGNTALRAVNFRVPPNGTLVTRDRI